MCGYGCSITVFIIVAVAVAVVVDVKPRHNKLIPADSTSSLQLLNTAAATASAISLPESEDDLQGINCPSPPLSLLTF